MSEAKNIGEQVGRQKKTSPPRKPETPARPEPEPTPREKLIAEAADNLTYKSDLSEDQKAALRWVQDNFTAFNIEMEKLLDFSPIRKRVTLTADYKAFQDSSREAERRANAAIACDWKEDSAFDGDTAEGIPYPVKEDATDERQRLCFQASKACFELTMKLIKFLPLGRYLSIFRTEMEVARGWLLDTINRN